MYKCVTVEKRKIIYQNCIILDSTIYVAITGQINTANMRKTNKVLSSIHYTLMTINKIGNGFLTFVIILLYPKVDIIYQLLQSQLHWMLSSPELYQSNLPPPSVGHQEVLLQSIGFNPLTFH